VGKNDLMFSPFLHSLRFSFDKPNVNKATADDINTECILEFDINKDCKVCSKDPGHHNKPCGQSQRSNKNDVF
jgi:hypothetical protein